MSRRAMASYHGGRDRVRHPPTDKILVEYRQTPGLTAHLRNYVQLPSHSAPAWALEPEMPTPEEVGSLFGGQVVERDVELQPNKEMGGWDSIEDYLETQYKLLRYDSITPLRSAVDEVRESPWLVERDSMENAKIYENVYITGLTLARDGVALKVEFSTRRTERKIRWAQSRRLRTGTAVALTPVEDNFQTKCIVAVVASRPLSAVDVELPEKSSVHLYFARQEELEIDPQKEFLMVEASSGYWEAARHTLKSLQKLRIEKFPLSQHVVEAKPTVSTLQRRVDEPFMNLSSIHKDGPFTANVLESLSSGEDQSAQNRQQGASEESISRDQRLNSMLDRSQLEALQRILTKELAIVQGPPGTGKTFVSVAALKILLSEVRPGDPPIIVTAHTNHALDQLLRHIGKFEKEFIRLGGQSTDKENIVPRTLYSVRDRERIGSSPNLSRARNWQKTLGRELETLLEPLSLSDPISPSFFLQYGLLTQAQIDSLKGIESEWVGMDDEEQGGEMGIYCDLSIVKAVKKNLLLTVGYFGEYDEDEILDEVALETPENDDDRFELLRGKFIGFSAGFTENSEKGFKTFRDSEIEDILKNNQDLTKIAKSYRGAVYVYLQRRLKGILLEKAQKFAFEAKKLAVDIQVGRWETDHSVLKKARIIGMTTTGLSKYRGLITSLHPKIVMIEEAAETLEAYTVAACFESLEQLILVGDHQQLRGRCCCPEMEGEPVFLDVSMFERLVNSKIEFTQLKVQRRMNPEIREIITPIYEDLVDHDSVKGRPDVPGMGGVNSFFFNHSFDETNDDALSKKNTLEADMIVGFFHYLVCNQIPPKDITILTFYNGQKKLISRLLHAHPTFSGCSFNVCTVDSYQGEENEIVLLSLVRYNPRRHIGFLVDLNRVCVALSRARRGFYIFGNGRILAENLPKWKEILMVLYESGRFVEAISLTCQKHQKETKIWSPVEFDQLQGGCKADCGGQLPCGHKCSSKCHPYPHEDMKCRSPCTNTMPCGHLCDNECWVRPCKCDQCAFRRPYRTARESEGRHAAMPEWEKESASRKEVKNDLVKAQTSSARSRVFPPPVTANEKASSSVPKARSGRVREMVVTSTSVSPVKDKSKREENLIDIGDDASNQEAASSSGRRIWRDTLTYR